VRRLRRRNASACTRALQSTGARARDETMAILPHASTHRQLVEYSGESSRGRRGHWSFLPFCLAFLDGDRTRRKPSNLIGMTSDPWPHFFNPFVRARPA
jgi:hypothetical protein